MHTSRSAAAIAAALILHARPPLRKNELVTITGRAWSAVQRGVESLVARDLIIVTSSKGYDAYTANEDSVYYPALRAAALADGGISEALEPLARRLRFVSVIGSFVWGHPTAASDIDLLVVGNVTKQEVAGALRPLAELYERQIDAIVYTDEEMYARLAANDAMLANAIDGGIRIMGVASLVPSR